MFALPIISRTRAARSLILLSMALASLPGFAEEQVSVESIASGYFSAESYCDAGKRGVRNDPAQPYAEEIVFERCASRDGRFKYVERNARVKTTANWSDGKKYYRYLEYNRLYQTLSLDDPFLFGFYRDRSQVFPVFVFQVFSADPRRLVDRAERARYFQSYTASRALSTPEYTVFERFEGNTKDGERLWVRNADKSIARHEWLKGGGAVRFVEITSRQLNRPLTEADLWYAVPRSERYSLMNNPSVFIAGLLLAAGFAGALVWGWLFARASAIEDVVHMRGRLWRLVRRIFGGIAVALAAFFALAYKGEGILVPIVAGYWSAVAFGITACFMIASYPLGWLFGARRARR